MMAVFEAIKSIVMDDDATSIQFGTSVKPIPQTYEHLQLRCSVRSQNESGVEGLRISPLGTNSGNCTVSLLYHLNAVGSQYWNDSPTSSMILYYVASLGQSDAYSYSVMVVNIMDYANANKGLHLSQYGAAPTIGGDGNVSDDNRVWLGSSSRDGTFALTYFALESYPSGDPIRRGSSFHLYGWNSSN
tara:strand:+ start:721 stop:1284 length:564 start_codon:yes stop_codon:yes gene_type:complete